MTSKLDRIQENANKFIVKNCTSCRYTPKRYIDGIDYICWNAQNFNSSVRRLCQDCTDCIIKQVIEKCKKHNNTYPVWEILNMFDIEEINK